MDSDITMGGSRLFKWRPVLVASFLGIATILPAKAAPPLSATADRVLTQYRAGGPRLGQEVARLVLQDLDYIEAFCQAARPARPAQRAGVAAGFVESVAVLFRADQDRAVEAGRRIRACCDLIVDGDPETRIEVGVELALSARSVLERHAESAEQLNDLVGFCHDEVVETAYQVALGSDRIGLLIGSDVEATQNLGDIQDALSGGDFGGFASPN